MRLSDEKFKTYSLEGDIQEKEMDAKTLTESELTGLALGWIIIVQL